MSQDIGVALNPRWVRAFSVWGLWVAGGLVVAGGVGYEFAQEFAGGGVDDSEVEIVDQDQDAGSGVGGLPRVFRTVEFAFIMRRAANSGIRCGLRVVSGSRVRSEFVVDCRTVRCSGQCPPSLSSVSDTRCDALARSSGWRKTIPPAHYPNIDRSPTECRNPSRIRVARYSADVYCVPRSECIIQSGSSR